jgi:magnesium-transporting ATPase (P-type)
MRQSSVAIVHQSIEWYFKELAAKSDKKIRKKLEMNPKPEGLPDGEQLYNMFRLLAVCHTVVVDKDHKTGELQYQASSPDELALIQGAKQAGLTLLEKSQKEMVIQNVLLKRVEKYEILAEFPFDSTRKRMSLIVRYDGKLILMTKGADSIMLPRI